MASRMHVCVRWAWALVGDCCDWHSHMPHGHGARAACAHRGGTHGREQCLLV